MHLVAFTAQIHWSLFILIKGMVPLICEHCDLMHSIGDSCSPTSDIPLEPEIHVGAIFLALGLGLVLEVHELALITMRAFSLGKEFASWNVKELAFRAIFTAAMKMIAACLDILFARR